MEWYKTLDINTRINAKECFKLLTGHSWAELSFLLSFRDRVDIMYNKLKLEGFDV